MDSIKTKKKMDSQKLFTFVRHYIDMILRPGYQEYKTIAL